MKAVPIAFLLIFSHFTLLTYDPYMVAHFDNHQDAYIYWRQARQRSLTQDGMILIHFDAHHDMDCLVGDYYEQWLSTYELPPEQVEGVTNATFIDAAINEGLIREIWWVIPDYMYWGTYDDLETFVYQNSPKPFHKYVRFCDCQNEGGHIACTLMDVHQVAPPLPTIDLYKNMGVRVHFITIGMLPQFEKEVLLDIDTDYFINVQDISEYPSYFHEGDSVKPWISVETFMDVIKNSKMRSRVVTIAVSPPYTPEEYHSLSWFLAECIDEYLSGIYGGRTQRFSIA